MKRIAIFTSALLLICGMTGCGNSSTNHDAVYTDVNPFNENEVRHIEERNVDAEPPEEWLYTEIAVDEKHNTYLRYITSVETIGATEAESNEDSEPAVEIDLFDGAEINIGSSDYPRNVAAAFQGKFEGVEVDCTVISATPAKVTIRACANENSQVLVENNYKLKEAAKDFEISVSEIPHTLLRNDEITMEIEDELIDGMTEEIVDQLTMSAEMEGYLSGESVQVPEISPLALYTVLPPEDKEFIEAEVTSSIGIYELYAGGDYLNYAVYAVLTDHQGTYFATKAYVQFDENGSLELADYQYLCDATLTYSFQNFESAYACIEEAYRYVADTTVLSEIKTY